MKAIYLAILASFVMSAAITHVANARLGYPPSAAFMPTLMCALFFSALASLVYLIASGP